MTDELFKIEPTKSPRLRWMERHHLSVEKYWMVDMWYYRAKHGMKVIGKGETEDDALFAAAKSLNIKLWNEE